jgi:hypothetical protein
MGSEIESTLRLRDPDAFYARLIALHDNLDPDTSNRLNASIILLMANQIGDDAVLHRILDHAAKSVSES